MRNLRILLDVSMIQLTLIQDLKLILYYSIDDEAIGDESQISVIIFSVKCIL